jgi:hypothetical protein
MLTRDSISASPSGESGAASVVATALPPVPPQTRLALMFLTGPGSPRLVSVMKQILTKVVVVGGLLAGLGGFALAEEFLFRSNIIGVEIGRNINARAATLALDSPFRDANLQCFELSCAYLNR